MEPALGTTKLAGPVEIRIGHGRRGAGKVDLAGGKEGEDRIEPGKRDVLLAIEARGRKGRKGGLQLRLPGLLHLVGNIRGNDRGAVRGGRVDERLHLGPQGEGGVQRADLEHAAAENHLFVVQPGIGRGQRIAGKVDQGGTEMLDAAGRHRREGGQHGRLVHVERDGRGGRERIDSNGPGRHVAPGGHLALEQAASRGRIVGVALIAAFLARRFHRPVLCRSHVVVTRLVSPLRGFLLAVE